jgi:cytochrome c biogenesis protein CcdA
LVSLASVGLAGLAGILSTLSPCVLPLIPMVLGAAVGEHRHGTVALAAGLAVSFVAIGMFVATVGYALGLDAGYFRVIGAVLLMAIGLVLLVPALQTRFAVVAGPISGWTDSRFGGFARTGLRGQFALGLLLGAVWTPCVGPTLGAASMLASRGEDLGQVSLVMGAFGVGEGRRSNTTRKRLRASAITTDFRCTSRRVRKAPFTFLRSPVPPASLHPIE